MKYSSLLRAGVIAFAGLLSACGAIQTSPTLPDGNERIAVKVIPADIGLNDIPVGAYHVPDTSVVVVSGRQMSRGEGAFGVFGVLAAHSTGKEEAKNQLSGSEAALRVDMAAAVESKLKAKMAQVRTSRLSTAPAAKGVPVLEIAPMAFLAASATPGLMQLQLILKARLLDGSGAETWATQYISHNGKLRGLAGSDSWTAQGGRALRAAIEESIGEALDVLFVDARGSKAGWENRPVKMTATFAGTAVPLTFEGLVLREDKNRVVLTPKVGPAIFRGVTVMPRADVKFEKL